MKTSLGRRVLFTVIALQAVTVAVVILWTVYFVNRDLRDLARQSAELTVAEVIRTAELYFQPAIGTAEQLTALYDARVLTADDPRALENYMIERLVAWPNLDGVYVAWPDGSFFHVKRDDGFAAGSFRTKTIRVADGARTVSLIWRDRQGVEKKRESLAEDLYDPRTRPWFTAAREAGGLAWTDPYVFFTSRRPGITVSLPTTEQAGGPLSAVVGVDIEMGRISAQLSQMGLRHGGTAFIVDREGRVLAHPHQVVTVGSGSDVDSLRFIEIEALEGVGGAVAQGVRERLASAIASALPILWSDEWQGHSYHVAGSTLDSLGWPWAVVAAVEEGKPVEAFEVKLFVLAVVVASIFLLTLVLSLILGRSVDRPIARLRDNMRLAVNGNYEVMADLESTAGEMKEIDEGLRDLAKQLRDRRSS